jgi:hypothetical protein
MSDFLRCAKQKLNKNKKKEVNLYGLNNNNWLVQSCQPLGSKKNVYKSKSKVQLSL